MCRIESKNLQDAESAGAAERKSQSTNRLIEMYERLNLSRGLSAYTDIQKESLSKRLDQLADYASGP
jgi:hypothetical protein